MNKKTMIAAIKAVKAKNPIMPILDSVMIGEGYVEVTDLETSVCIPFDTGDTLSCIEANKFIAALELMDSFKIKTTGDIHDKNGHGVELSNGKRTIKVVGEQVESFPMNLPSDAQQMNQVGILTQEDLEHIHTALGYTGDDDLRPSMTGVYLNDEIAATDAHRMCWYDLSGPFMEDMIVPAKTCKALLIIGGEWKVFREGSSLVKQPNGEVKEVDGIRIAFTNDEGVTVIARRIDARYPNYKVVIPDIKETKSKFTCSVSDLKAEVKNAIKFSHPNTSQVVLSLNGKTTIYSSDVDKGHEYTAELVGTHEQEDLKIAFNGKMMMDTLNHLPAKGKVVLNMFSETKAIIINNHSLIMPLMLNK